MSATAGAGAGARRDLLRLEDGAALLALPFHESVEAWETLLIQRALQDSGGSKTDAARRLGIHRRLLYEKLQKLRPQPESGSR